MCSLVANHSQAMKAIQRTPDTARREMMVGDDQEKVVDASKSAVTRVRFAPIRRNAPRKSTRCIDCLEKTRGLDSDGLP